ncbi:MAG: radical SAM family heme chaperone HemW [Bacteroidaceae bacterium]|nr:radical SAM family heme chaperone HemW [Bacteroidaceae bacterium]
MAGIYFHVPFCKSRCRYCDFFSSTMEELKVPYVEAVCRELSQRKDYLQGETVETLYFGGGTPSRLSHDLFRKIFEEGKKIFGEQISRDEEGKKSCAEKTHHDGQISLRECTVEVNPDDVSPAWIENLVGVWKEVMGDSCPLRISMGIQSFHDSLLTLIGRRHNTRQAIDAVETLREAGITEISIDLMYGLPGETPEMWHEDLTQAISLRVPHISAYHLSYESGTALWQMREKGSVSEVDEDMSVLFFRMLRNELLKAGYEHYEISNFALSGHHAKHNSSYWSGVPYLGIGPGAHSYNGSSRRWNAGDIKHYVETKDFTREGDNACFTTEILSAEDKYDEYIMTRLRTAKGASLEEVGNLFGEKRLNYLIDKAQPYIHSQRLRLLEEGYLTLSPEALFVSDGIIADLFADD